VIRRGTPECDNDFNPIATSKVESVEDFKQSRIIQKFGKSRPATIGAVVDLKHIDVEINADAAPFRRLNDLTYEPNGVTARLWRNGRDSIAKPGSEKKYRQKEAMTGAQFPQESTAEDKAKSPPERDMELPEFRKSEQAEEE
jgi:hypothetical protein